LEFQVSDEGQDKFLLEIRARDKDVKTYLEGHMTRLPSFVQNNPNLKGEIKTEVAGAVDGMYVAFLYFLSRLTKLTMCSGFS
jgi:hypothetical protein